MNGSTRLILACFVVLTSHSALAQPPGIRVGVWNIEALSASAKRGFPEQQGAAALPPRSDEDLEAIAEYLKDEIKVDALMITEIAADAESSTEARPQSEQLNTICGHLGSNWRYFLGRTGGKMRLGLLFNENRIQLKKLVNLDAEPFFVSGKDVFDRDPFIVWINAIQGGQPKNDLLLICLHLKSQQKPFRHNRMSAIAKLLGDISDKKSREELTLPSNTEEPEVFILGDCNDASHSEPGFKFMFDYLGGVGFTHLKPSSGPYPRTRFNGSQIDHIFASSKGLSGMVANSFRVHTVPDTQEDNDAYRARFSDHFPLTIDVAVQPDGDATLSEVLAISDDEERATRLAELTDEIRSRIEPDEDTEDEDTEPIVIKNQVIEGDFERILAPRVGEISDDHPTEDAAPANEPDSTDQSSEFSPMQKAAGMLAEQSAVFQSSHDVSSDEHEAFTSTRESPQLKVYIPRGSTLPDELRSQVAESYQKYSVDAELAKQLIIERPNREVIRDAVDSDEIAAIEIARPPSVGPNIPLVPFNREARLTHTVDELLSTFEDSHDHGASVRAAVFDGGRIRTSHQEFKDDAGSSRVDVHQSTTNSLSSHSTHVAGTMGARGAKEKARGMAKRLHLTSFDFRDDLNTLETVASQFRVSNHSYGPISGWNFDSTSGWEWWGDTTTSPVEDAKFGKYGIDNRQLDDILHRNPELLAVVAAGNDRNDQPDMQPILHWAMAINPATGQLDWVQSATTRPGDGNDHGGLDTIAGLGVSKNCLCIGAIHDITNASEAIQTTDFSSWGPVDDGRIKPDLVANGQDLFSASSASDSAYLEMPGTSMASPTAAGIASVLIEHFKSKKGHFPSSAEVKAVLIHSAEDDATNPGPDPLYGWGSINAFAAGELIAGDGGESIQSADVQADGTKEWTFVRPAGLNKPVRVTLVWTDPPAVPNTSGLDDSTPSLVNDLDLEVIGPASAVPLHPYSLNLSNPLSPATTTGANRVDNVEVIDAPSAAGTWTVRVVAHGITVGQSQRFTIIVSGLALDGARETTSRN